MRDHGRTVQGLYRLLGDLLGLEVELREESGQTDAEPGHPLLITADDLRREKAPLDLARLAEALTARSGEQYPLAIVKALEAYDQATAKEKQAKRTADLARLAWQGVLGRFSPKGVAVMAGYYGSVVHAATVEYLLTHGGERLSLEVRVKRLYLAIVLDSAAVRSELANRRSSTKAREIVKNVYVERRLDALGTGPLVAAIRGVDLEAIRREAEFVRKSAVTDKTRTANISERSAQSGSSCPTPDERKPAVKKASSRRPRSKKR